MKYSYLSLHQILSQRLPILAFCLVILVPVVVSQSISDARQENVISVDVIDPGYLQGDSNYHGITAASDGRIYFAVNTHHPYSSARLYRFDPDNQQIEMLGDITEILGIDPTMEIPHGKIHTPLIEHDGYLYFATHTSQYEGNLPDMSPDDGRVPFQGGHFMRYSLASGQFEDLVPLHLPNEGIISMALDPNSSTLYGLTWPTGLLISFQLDERLVHNWGAVQERGEWGQLPEEWDFICRRLAMDPEGNLFGSTDSGRIWRFEKGLQRPVHYLDNVSLDRVPAVQDEGFVFENAPHFYWRNWRTILWNPNTQSFWGLHGGSSQLFEFLPKEGEVRSVFPMRVKGTTSGQRNPFRSQLGLMLGPENTLFYLAHGPSRHIVDRRDVDTSVHLLTYNIDSGEFIDHGALVAPGNRRVFFTESIEIGPDDHIYSVAWVETTDPNRMTEILSARKNAAPEETDEVLYEMLLVRLPVWQSFIHR